MFQRQLACQSILDTTEPLAWSCDSFHLHPLLGVDSMARIPRSQPHPRSFRTGQVQKESGELGQAGTILALGRIFLWSAPVAFRRVALETPEWTSRDSNHHRQSVSAGKTNAIPTEPSGRLILALGRNPATRARAGAMRLSHGCSSGSTAIG